MSFTSIGQVNRWAYTDSTQQTTTANATRATSTTWRTPDHGGPSRPSQTIADGGTMPTSLVRVMALASMDVDIQKIRAIKSLEGASRSLPFTGAQAAKLTSQTTTWKVLVKNLKTVCHQSIVWHWWNERRIMSSNDLLSTDIDTMNLNETRLLSLPLI